jgi:hypothetical protein
MFLPQTKIARFQQHFKLNGLMEWHASVTADKIELAQAEY